jgi:predicted glycosyltransferase
MADLDSNRSLRVLHYSVNGTGLGHLTRLMAIGRWIRIILNGLDLQARPFFLSCSEADFLVADQGFPSIKLPSKNTLKKANLSDREAVEQIRGFARAAFDGLQPDVLVVDTFPTGSYDELLPILGQEDVTKVFIFREQRSEYASQIPYDRLLLNFDLMLVPHPEGFFEIPFELPPGLPVAWAGDIIFGERDELLSRSAARERLGLGADDTVVYTAAGGGGDPDSVRTLEMIVETVRQLPDVQIVVGAGPLSREPGRSEDDLLWTSHFPISRLFRGFDFAISSSGYNTVNELLYFGLPAILYPQVRGADDQLARAQRAADEGCALAIDQLTPAKLTEALERIADPAVRSALSERARARVATNGARKAAESILKVALQRKYPDTDLASQVSSEVS